MLYPALGNKEKREMISRILEEDQEQRHRVQVLKLELFELEQAGAYCDADRIKEIIDELELIDPCSEEHEISESEMQAQKERTKLTMRETLRKNETKIRLARLSRFGKRSAMVLITLAILSVSASAFGFNILTLIVSWTKEFFSFGSSVESECFAIHLKEPVHEEYDNLAEAFESFKFNVAIPKWVPDGYELQKIQVKHAPTDEHVFIIIYTNAEEKGLVFRATIYHNDMKPISALFEKNDEPLTYTYNGTEHYIMMNDGGNVNATWNKDDTIYTFIGDVSIEDAQKIIKSYY